MFSAAEMHLAYRLGNARILEYPYPHFYQTDVFPAAYYRDMLAHLPSPQDMVPIAQARGVRGYDERFVFDFSAKSLAALPPAKGGFWRSLHQWMVVQGSFNTLVFQRMKPYITKRFGDVSGLNLYSETLLVQDTVNYSLGPHTDAVRKVVTLLFYLPADDTQAHLGTSLYVPNDPAFTCRGGPHHERSRFSRLHTMPFLPNTLFAFAKTDNSFHGVEPVTGADTRRWLLLYDIYLREKPMGDVAQWRPLPRHAV